MDFWLITSVHVAPLDFHFLKSPPGLLYFVWRQVYPLDILDLDVQTAGLVDAQHLWRMAVTSMLLQTCASAHFQMSPPRPQAKSKRLSASPANLQLNRSCLNEQHQS